MMMSLLLSIIPSNLYYRGLLNSSLAVLLTIIMECTCLDEVRKLCSTSYGRELYKSAIYANLLNNIILGSITYYIAIKYFCQNDIVLPVYEQMKAAFGLVIIEAILYYLLHKAFHEVKGLYWMHSYHHKFNTIVLPSSANAVSIAEYIIAYMIPLVIGATIMQCDEIAAFTGSAIVGITNILIHTPWLENKQNNLHWIFVTASDHLNHHRKTRGNYGAPVFHLDRIMESFSSNNDKQST